MAAFFYSDENCNIVLHINFTLFGASKYKYFDENYNILVLYF
jgi:hypothetical protein